MPSASPANVIADLTITEDEPELLEYEHKSKQHEPPIMLSSIVVAPAQQQKTSRSTPSPSAPLPAELDAPPTLGVSAFDKRLPRFLCCGCCTCIAVVLLMVPVSYTHLTLPTICSV